MVYNREASPDGAAAQAGAKPTSFTGVLIESPMIVLERLLALVTGVIVAICLGLGLMMMALGPGKKADEAEAVSAPVDAAAPLEAAPAEQVSPVALQPAAPPADPQATARSEVETALRGATEYQRFFDHLRLAFPSDYESVLEAFVRERMGGGEPNVDYYLSEAVRQLRQSRGVLAAKAEGPALARIFDLRLDVVRAIAAEDARLCVAFLYGDADQDFHDFAARRRTLVAEMALAGLEAIASGRAKNIQRTAPSDEDFRALEAALAARGLGKVEIGALLDGKTPDPPLEDKRMCAAGLTYLEVLRALPETIRLRIYGLAVELMARS
jgi:hypothetical protein